MPDKPVRLRGMILTLTERCNLRCDYCYVPVERGQTMSRETAERAVDLLAANAAAEGELNLSFFGGEPFLAGTEMRLSVERVRARLPGRVLRVVTPTNGLALSAEDLAWSRREGIELAVSIDGPAEAGERRHCDGRTCGSEIASVLPEILRRLPPGSVVARMTVTTANVASLCANVRALARLGLERIVYQPDYLGGWDDVSLAVWRREHQRLATWMIGARAAGRKLPDLPAWRAIAARLVRKRPRQRCGAGIDQVTVAPNGDIYPCFRFPFAARAETWRLGDVRSGLVESARLQQLRALDCDRLRPERGACADCPARDGCTHYCPALGFLAAGDIAHVPDVACRLMQAEVASVRDLVAASRSTAKPASPGWAAAALLAAAISGVAGCGRNDLYPPVNPDAGDKGMTSDAGIGGGICAVYINLDVAPDLKPASGADAANQDKTAVDADEPDLREPYYGGYCP